MAKQKDKYIKIINGNYWARITYLDEQGKRHEVKRRADNKTHAKQLVQQLLLEIHQYGSSSLGSAQMTFLELAEYYKKKYLIPPQYVDGRKVAGLRAHKKHGFSLEAIKDYFGKKKLRSVTPGDIEGFRLKRLNTPVALQVKKQKPGEAPNLPTKPPKQRTVATVNRELSLLRRMLSVAHREGWILKNPFLGTDRLISTAEEPKRDRVLSKEEEVLLLEKCIDERSHLRAIVICALDTGMRAGEIFSLTWQDINFDKEIITVQALNTKTLRSRQIALTDRLKLELVELYKVASSDKDKVFGFTTVSRSFNTVKKNCNFHDLRFHDLRHTAATRMIQMGLPLQEVGRILGHTQANTTYRYVNANTDTARRAAQAMNDFHAQVTKKEGNKEDEQEEMIN